MPVQQAVALGKHASSVPSLTDAAARRMSSTTDTGSVVRCLFSELVEVHKRRYNLVLSLSPSLARVHGDNLRL